MAKVRFDKGAIKAIVTTVGDRLLSIDEEAEKFGYDERTLKRVKKSMGFHTRRVVSDPSVCTSDLCAQSAGRLFELTGVDPASIDALIMVTQTPDYRAPSTAIILQDRLGLGTGTVAFDINLGCSGFINGLYTAYAMIASGLQRVLLCVGDVASKFAYERDKVLTPLMGDAGSAILIEAEASESHFVLHSDGSGFEHLIIPAGGCRYPCSLEALEPKARPDGAVRRDVDMYMNGGEIFNFTLKAVPEMFDELFAFAGVEKERIDYFVLHQANRYILQNIAKRIGVDEERLPMKTVTEYGNQNSASIPGTINAFLHEPFSGRSLRSVFAGFGIGLSWGACLVETDGIVAPEPLIYKGAST
ncbi:ketoacyl-ACP synthase III [Nitratifractor sp.]